MDSLDASCKYPTNEALDKLGFKHLYGQSQVEPVQPNVAFDIASLVLYGTQALPIRLKILLDRLFSVLQREEVLQVLHGFGWTHEDYARGYILQEPHGTVLERWNICSPEEEPLVLQQFLRFGETRAITQQLLLAQADQAALHSAAATAAASAAERERSSSTAGDRDKDRDRDRDPMKPGTPADSKSKTVDKTGLKPPKLESSVPGLDDRSKSFRDDRSSSRPRNISPPRRLSPPHMNAHAPSSTRPSPAPPSPLQKQSPLNLLKLPPQNGPSCTVSSPPSSLNSSPLSVSPLNRLQSMQPFDYRKMTGGSSGGSGAGGGPFPANDAGRRRASETSDTSPSMNVTSPTWHLPPPLPLPSSTSSSTPVNLSHTGLSTNSLSAAGLVASSFTGLISSAGGGPESKSPSMKAEKTASSEFGSEEDDEDDENSHSALNLSRDAASKVIKKPNHQRKGVSPLKRAWGTSSALPLNLGTQLINPATGKKRVQCNVCLKTFCDKGALKIHFSAVHLREMHKCTVEGCNMMFSSRRSRNRHSANPNPKLHSPHLRRKISPHDGRSSQSHPILIPPHGALSLPGGGLNPLSFGAFPLLTPPPELRHQASALDLKQSLDLTLSKFDDRRGEYTCNTNQSSDDGVGPNPNSQYDEMDDEEDYEGIVVVGDDEQDQDMEDHNEKNSEEDLSSKRAKMSVSDMDDIGSNVDSNEDSLSVVDNQSVKEEAVADGAAAAALSNQEKPRRGRKRKNQNPTRCAIPVRTSHDDGMSTDGEGSGETDAIFSQNKDEARKVGEETRKTDEAAKEEEDGEEKTDGKVDEDGEVNSKRGEQSGSDHEDGNPLRRLESLSHGRFGDSGKTDGESGQYPGFATGAGGQLSPAKSHGSTGSNGPDSPTDEGSEGCNAAFPSKRSRDRHSANLNLHRKLLSTEKTGGANNSGAGGGLWDKVPFASSPAFHTDFLSRLYSETAQSLPALNYDAFKAHPHLSVPEGLLNGERMLPSGHLPFPGLGFPGLNFVGHPFLQNGLDRKQQQQQEHRSGSSSPNSPPTGATSPAPSLDLDVPTPDRDGLLPCKYCKKPCSDGASLREHYEQSHASELFKCTVPGCSKVFTSRTKRNSHAERHMDGAAAAAPTGGAPAALRRRGSASSAENGS